MAATHFLAERRFQDFLLHMSRCIRFKINTERKKDKNRQAKQERERERERDRGEREREEKTTNGTALCMRSAV